MFLPGLSDSDCSGNIMVNPLVVLLQAFCTALAAPITGAGVDAPYIVNAWSARSGVAPFTAAPYDVLNWEVSLLIGTQRGRLHPAI
jgi:hypothetical protein